METKTDIKLGPTRRKSTTNCVKVCPKEERNASLKKVAVILQKPENERTIEEQQTLDEYSEIVTDLKLRWQRRDEAKRRMEEVEESPEVLQEKCLMLAKAIANSEHLVIYTGAGISTAARIPDYRGTNGIWTRLQQGKDIGNHDLSLAEPTYTHMSLYELYSRKILKYVVSQNCDGLHLRSGLPRSALSELHGNMYIEVCKYCKPAREYWRLFDVTENTARYSHKTMRRCYVCSKELIDTIVHFGERGTLQWPLNWKGACMNADKADTILCLGSSLKVLKRYPWLWQMNKPVKKRPNLFIVNLQWTPKDESAVLKINGKCDYVMKMVMKYLGIETPAYNRDRDPIFAHATLLLESEMHTTNQPHLKTDNEMSSSKKTESPSESCDEENKSGEKTRSVDGIKNESGDEIKNEVDEIKKENYLENRNSNENVSEKYKLEIGVSNLENKMKKDVILENSIKKEETKVENGVKEEIKLTNGLKTEDIDQMEYTDDDSVNIAINNETLNVDTLYYEEEQIEAIDYSKNKNDKLVNNVINCDKNTHTSIKTSRLSINNGSSSSKMSEQTSRKIYSNNTPSVISNNSIFSVDSILNKNIINKNDNSTNITNENNTNNYQKLMAYYELANTVLQNQMLSYFTSNFYPYQTSFLYPGLHSIINPIPFINYDFNCAEMPQPNQSTSTNIVQIIPNCSFCKKTFDSNTCLFYSSTEPKFLNELYRFSKKDNCNKLLVCVCCDYTTDEDEEEESDSSENKKIKTENDDTESVCENNELKKNKEDGNNKISKIQAGWFGKGYRKNRRIKKR